MGSLIFRFGSVLIRPMTQALTDYLVKQGGKKVAKNVAASLIKKGQGFKTVGSKKALQNALPKNKSLTVIKPKSTALTKVAPKSITKIGAGKATTIAGLAGAIPFIDKGGSGEVKKSSANTKKGKVDAGLQEALKKKARDAKNKKMNDIEKSTRGQKSKSTTTTMTFGKAFRAAKDAGKKEFTYKGKKYHTRTKDEDKKAAGNPPIPKSRPKTEKKVEKKIEKKVDAPLKKVQKNITAGKNTGFGPRGNIFPTSPKERKELMKKYGGTGSEAAKNSKVGKQGNRKGIGRA